MNDAFLSVSMHEWKMIMKDFYDVVGFDEIEQDVTQRFEDGWYFQRRKPLEPGDFTGNMLVSFVASGDAGGGGGVSLA